MIDKVPKNKIVLVDFSYAVFCLLDVLTFEDGTSRLSGNISKEFPLQAA